MSLRAQKLSLAAGPLLLLTAVAMSGLVVINQFDVPWYLRAGEEILRTGQIPRFDPFSLGPAKFWLNHEWLAEVGLALINRLGGSFALSLWQGALLALTVALAWWPAKFSSKVAMATALAAMLLRENLSPRAQLISLALTAATASLALLDFQRQLDNQPQRKFYRDPLALVPLLQLFWTQVHGGNPHGVIILSLLFIAAPSWRRLGYTLLAALFTGVGPYGFRVHEHFFSARHSLTAIREWQPLPTALVGHPLFGLGLLLLLAMAAATIIALFKKQGQRASRFSILLFLVYLIAAVRYVRFAQEAIVVALAIISLNLTTLKIDWLKKPASWVAAAILIISSIFFSERQWGVGFAAQRFPIAAVDFLQQARLSGPMFNSYNFGGYLLWAYPQERVFIDGRAFTVYPAAQIDKLLQIYKQPQLFRDLEKQYGFRLAVLQRRGAGEAFGHWLREQPDWQLKYEDEVALVLVRK